MGVGIEDRGVGDGGRRLWPLPRLPLTRDDRGHDIEIYIRFQNPPAN